MRHGEVARLASEAHLCLRPSSLFRRTGYSKTRRMHEKVDTHRCDDPEPEPEPGLGLTFLGYDMEATITAINSLRPLARAYPSASAFERRHCQGIILLWFNPPCHTSRDSDVLCLALVRIRDIEDAQSSVSCPAPAKHRVRALSAGHCLSDTSIRVTFETHRARDRKKPLVPFVCLTWKKPELGSMGPLLRQLAIGASFAMWQTMIWLSSSPSFGRSTDRLSTLPTSPKRKLVQQTVSIQRIS